MALTWFVIFFLGAMMGSFLNVVGLRFLREESIIWPGSHCYSCNQKIKPYDNIPVLSWLLLRGKCRSCKSPISWQYPAIELLTGLLVVAAVLQFGATWQAAFLIYLIFNFMVILITDFREHYIFDVNSIGLIPFGFIYAYFNLGNVPGEVQIPFWHSSMTVPYIFVSALVAVFGAFLIFFVLNLVSKLLVGKPGFGEGDTRLLMGIGSFFGVKVMLFVFMLSFLIQVCAGIPLLVFQWFQARAYKTLALMGLGFACAILPYLLQYAIPRNGLLMLLTLGLGGVAIFCAMKALRLAQDLPSGLTYLPFGPAIVLAALLMIFFEAPILAAFSQFFPL